MARWLALILAVVALATVLIAEPFSDQAERSVPAEKSAQGLSALASFPTMCVRKPGKPYFISSMHVFSPAVRKTPLDAIEAALPNRTDLNASGFTLAEPKREEGTGKYVFVDSGVIKATVEVGRFGQRFGANGLSQCEPA